MWGIVANGLYGAFKPLFDPFGNLVAYLGFGGLGLGFGECCGVFC